MDEQRERERRVKTILAEETFLNILTLPMCYQTTLIWVILRGYAFPIFELAHR
jgi:hypothetical protein